MYSTHPIDISGRIRMDCLKRVTFCLFYVLFIGEMVGGRSLRKRSTSTCTLFNKSITVTLPRCQPSSAINVTECSGSCPSYTTPDDTGSVLVSTCRCCKVINYTIIRVQLHCLDAQNSPVTQYHDVVKPYECACNPC